MRRRDFVKGLGVAGGLAALPWHSLLADAASAQAAGAPAPEAMAPESRKAWSELLALVAEAERRTLSAEWNVRSPQEVIDGHAFALHLLAAGIDLYLDARSRAPALRVDGLAHAQVPGRQPRRVLLPGAALAAIAAYRIRGNIAGRGLHLVHVPDERRDGLGERDLRRAQRPQLDVARDGSYELVLAPAAASGRNGVSRSTPTRSRSRRGTTSRTRLCAQLDPTLRVPLAIEPLADPAPAAAAGRRRRARARMRAVVRFVRESHARHAAARPEAAARVGLDGAEPARCTRALRRASESRRGARSTTPTAWARSCWGPTTRW